jgi:DNA-binding NarL/FixJ family response regulator
VNSVIEVVIVDDHELVRLGLRGLLDRERDINVVGTAPDGERGLELIERFRPSVAVIDYNLPGMSGVELCEEVVRSCSDCRVVILTTFLDDAVIRNSIDAGAKAFVYKDVEGRDLMRAIRKVANGESVLDTRVAGRVMRWARARPTSEAATLSKRELEVLRLVSLGYTNRNIAEELSLSINTVKTCMLRMLRKLGCHSRVQAVSLATKRGLL